MALRRLLYPLIVVVTACFIGLVYVLTLTYNKLDDITLAGQKHSLLLQVQQDISVLGSLVEDNAWWNRAYDNLELELNKDFWVENMQGSAETLKEVDVALLLGKDKKIHYSYNPGKIRDIESFIFHGIDKIADSMRALNGYDPQTRLVITVYDTHIYLVGISILQQTVKEGQLSRLNARRNKLVFIKKLGAQDIQIMGKRINLSGLRTTTMDEIPEGYTHYPLRDLSEVAIVLGGQNTALVWKMDNPGAMIKAESAIPLLLCLLAVVAAFYYFYWQAQKLVMSEKCAHEVKSNFLKNMTHELRTPMNVVIGYSQMLQGKPFADDLTDDVLGYIQTIEISGQHLLGIINDILDLSKLEAGQYEAHLETLDIAEELDQCLALVDVLAKKKNITLDRRYQPGLFTADPRMFKQIMINLVDNAIKFTPERGRVGIVTELSDASVFIQITDTGIGMSPEEIEIACTEFGQVHSNYSRDTVGTGLGLPIVQRMIDLMEGDLSIRSEKDMGTIVTITLPNKAKNNGMGQPAVI